MTFVYVTILGADGGTRTRTVLPGRSQIDSVYQFRHVRWTSSKGESRAGVAREYFPRVIPLAIPLLSGLPGQP